MSDNLIPPVQDYINRDLSDRTPLPLPPAIFPTPDQNEQINNIATPLISNVNAWTLKFVTGQADIEKQWDEYKKSCEGLNQKGLEDLYAELYKKA